MIRTVAPIGYTIPMDGPVGELMKKTTISHMRPAHIHFCLESPGYHRVVTHLFQRGCPYIETDVVYGVKEPLIVDFVEEARRRGAERREGRHAVLRDQLRLRAAEERRQGRRGVNTPGGPGCDASGAAAPIAFPGLRCVALALHRARDASRLIHLPQAQFAAA